VEEDRGVARVLKGNVQRLGAGERALIEETSVARFSLKGEEGKTAPLASGRVPASGGASGIPFDVIFHDPPFKEISESDLQLLLPLVRIGGWLFHERGDDAVHRPLGLEPAERRRYGRTRFLIYRP
jgi:16S rRNA G966 N2-methylase RsmD